MAGLSEKAIYNPQNKRGYNGNELQNKEFSNGSGLELYDFNARTYDQQVGRFIQIDPLADKESQETLTPYHFGNNNPIRYSDPDGKCATCPKISIQGIFSQLWRSAGISSSTDAKAYVKGVGEAAKNPDNMAKATIVLGQFSVLTLAGVMTEGMGSGGIVRTGVRGIRNTVSSVTVESGETGLAARATTSETSIIVSSTDDLARGGNGTQAGKDIVGTSHSDVLPTQDWINPQQVSRYEKAIRSGEKVDPIITYKANGKTYIEDGHHRYVAGQKTGVPVPMVMRNTSGPVGPPNWLDVLYQKP